MSPRSSTSVLPPAKTTENTAAPCVSVVSNDNDESWSDTELQGLGLSRLQSDGFIFIWTPKEKHASCLTLLHTWGYSFVDQITWVTVQESQDHVKHPDTHEICVIGRKGNEPPNTTPLNGSEIIFSNPAKSKGGKNNSKTTQHKKPIELFEMVEKLIPGGFYLELFGSKDTFRDYWVTVESPRPVVPVAAATSRRS